MPDRVIHLVDDNDAVRCMLARLLKSGGYRVKEYGSGAALLKAIDKLECGTIVLDIDMPGADGFAVHRALVERSIDLPIVMMSGSGDFTILAMKAGVAEFMQKPFGRGELLSVLDQVSEKPRAS